MSGKMPGAVERETRERRPGPRPGSAARPGSEDWTHHGALRDRSETVREVSHENFKYNYGSPHG